MTKQNGSSHFTKIASVTNQKRLKEKVKKINFLHVVLIKLIKYFFQIYKYHYSRFFSVDVK